MRSFVCDAFSTTMKIKTPTNTSILTTISCAHMTFLLCSPPLHLFGGIDVGHHIQLPQNMNRLKQEEKTN